ncbi:MAG: 50S ribosome-binding GTPase [Planctomycetes bacterium]|nr:50S ribosome-binding GTPase [Planctomycetota bacterium]
MTVGGGMASWLTAGGAGAIAAFQVDAEPPLLAGALGIDLPAIGEAGLRRICDLDDAVVLRTSARTLLVTPHGGARIRQRLVRALMDAGVAFASPEQRAPEEIYVEAANELEARMLQAVAQAASADAIPLLLAQPGRWKLFGEPTSQDLPRSQRLRCLIHPPTVVLAGAPNAGKSTLLNALVGRTAAVASPVAGTTRDFVSARVLLAGLTCRVVDAPGFATSDDAIEQAAIARARRELAEADLVIALAAPHQAWPSFEQDRVLRIRTMSDLPRSAPSIGDNGNALRVSAKTGEGLIEFARAIREILVPAADLASNRPWQFW